MPNVGTFARSSSGSTLPVFGISLMGVFSIVGMAIALNFDSQAARSLQDTADTAAIAGATAFITATSGSADDHRQLAYDTADGFARANAEDELKSVAVSAVTTDEFGQHTEVNVLLEYHPANIFNRFAGKGETSPVTRSAKAIATREFPLCLLALATGGNGILIDDQGFLNAGDCAVWSNSAGSDSIEIASKSTVTTSSTCAAGFVKGGVSPSVTPVPSTNCQTIPDPLESWKPPTIGLCDSVGGLSLKAKPGDLLKVSPGVYCGGLFLKADDIELEPGLYVMKDGPLILDGQETMTGEGVTILLSGLNAGVNVRGHGKLKITAPASGPLAGMAIAEDRTTKALLKGGLFGPMLTQIDGHGEIYIEGAIYLPTQLFRVTGKGLGTKASPYLQIVADRIEISKKGELAIRFSEAEISVPVVIEPERIARLVR